MMRVPALVGAFAAAGLLSGCVTAVAPPAPAALTFAGSNCTAAPDLSLAQSLTPEKETALHSVYTQVGSATPCLQRDGRATSYVLYAIPTDYEDKTLTVGGYLEPLRILSPAVAVLDERGETSRSFRTDEFLYRGLNYSVLLRPRAGEKYVLVTVDPARVGQRYDSITIGTNTTTTYTGYGTASFTTGTDIGQSRQFSWEGAVQVAVNDSDTKEEAARR